MISCVRFRSQSRRLWVMIATSVAGATPKVTMSASESIWMPCMLAALNSRAAKPSNASKIIAQQISTALVANTDSALLEL